jgi:hypothetical protein
MIKMLDPLGTPIKDAIEAHRPYRLSAIKAIRAQSNLSLREALIVLANTFGFYADNVDDLTGWREFLKWSDENKVNLEMVQGPHAMTLLKMLAIKHGRAKRE